MIADTTTEESRQKLKDYFLGALSEHEAEEVELRVVADELSDVQLDTVETELIEQYLDEVLPEDERIKFISNYLSTPERVKNVQTILMLRRYARTIGPEANHTGGSRPWFRSWLRFTVPVYATALFLAGVLIAYLWFGSGRMPYPELQKQYESMNRQDLTNLDEFKGLTTLSISPGDLRGGSHNNLVGAATDRLFFRLSLPFEFRSYRQFDVRLMQNGVTLLDFKGQRTYSPSGMDGPIELRLLIPSEILDKNRYEIQVNPTDAAEFPLAYYFVRE